MEITAIEGIKQAKSALQKMKQDFENAQPILHKTYGHNKYSFAVIDAFGGGFIVKIITENEFGKQISKIAAPTARTEFGAINYAGKKLFAAWANVR